MMRSNGTAVRQITGDERRTEWNPEWQRLR
jgi:hypothetical protein